MLTKTSIKRPFTVVVMLVVIAIVGGVALFKMPLDLFPDMDLPYVVVATMVPGSSPEEIEKRVTSPLEDGLRQINNVKQVTSISADNVSAVIMELNNGTDMTTLRQDIDTKIDVIKGSFPDVSMKPIVMPIDPDMMPVMTVAISKKGHTIEQSSKELENITMKIKSIGGVANVTPTGQIENNVFMQVDAEKLLRDPVNMLVGHISDYLNNAMVAVPDELERVIASDELMSGLIGDIKSNPSNVVESLRVMLTESGIDISSIINGMLEGTEGFDKDTLLGAVSSMLTPKMLTMLLTANNFEMPAGTTPVDGLDFFIKIGEKVERYDELKHLPAFSLDLREFSTNPALKKGDKGYEDALMVNVITKTIKDKVPLTATNESIKQMVDDLFAGAGKPIPNILKNKIVSMVKKVLYTPTSSGYARNEANLNYLLGIFYQPITVELGDFAYMYNTNTASKSHTIINGADGIMLSIYKTPDASVTNVTNGVEKLLKDMHEQDNTITSIILSNQGEVTKFMLSSIAQNLLIGALFAIIVLLIFLKDWKPTLTVGMSILVSLVTAFAVMYLSGVTLNLVSMGGLALSVGMLVDNSIVVIENIYRKRNEGVSPIKAAYEGTKQVAGAILSSTITTVIVFLPIIFVEGITRQIFVDLAITIAVSLFASLLVAITFVPMVSSRMVKISKASRHESKVFTKMKKGYAKSLDFMLNRKWITLVIVLVLFVGSIVAVFFMDVEFMPDTTMEQIIVTTGIDDTKLDENYAYDEIVDDVITDINDRFREKKYIKEMGIELSAGMSVMGFTMGGGNIMSYVTLDKKAKIKPAEAQAELENIVKEIAADAKYPKDAVVLGGVKKADAVDVQGMVQSYMDASLLGINVYGLDIDDMRSVALDLADRLGAIGEDVVVNNGLVNETKEFKLVVDKNVASKYNLTTAQIFLDFFKASVPPSASTDINFTSDIGSSDIYIYTTDNNMERWYRPSDASGNKHRLYFNKSDDTATATRFEERKYNDKGEISEREIFQLDRNTGVFTSKSDSSIKYTIDPSDMPVYYDNSKINDVDMITYMVKVPKAGEMPDMDMQMPMASGAGMTEQKKSVPMFMLLDKVSFDDDAVTSRIKYRQASDPRFAGTIDDVNYYADQNGYIRYNYSEEDVATLKTLPAGDPNHPRVGYDNNPLVPAGIKLVYGFNTITHAEGNRVVQMNIKSATMSNSKLTAAAKKVIKEFNASNEIANIRVEFVGQNEIISDTFNALILMIVLAVVFIYLVMVAQFQSLKSPFIIMFTIPLALTGSILTLLMAGLPISVFALVGIILLVGIVVNNGIVFVDYVNKLMESGMPKREALLRAAQDRIRPILMTALTTICSMLISVFDTSMGASAIKPMAVTVVGGLTYATLLTLFLVPILYDLFNRKEKLAVIKFDDDVEDDIEAEMRLTKINDVQEVLEESNTLSMMDEGYIADNIPTATSVEESIDKATGLSSEATTDTEVVESEDELLADADEVEPSDAPLADTEVVESEDELLADADEVEPTDAPLADTEGVKSEGELLADADEVEPVDAPLADTEVVESEGELLADADEVEPTDAQLADTEESDDSKNN